MLSSGVRPEQSFYDSVRKQETEKTNMYRLNQVAIRMVEMPPLLSDVPMDGPEAAVKVMADMLKDYDREVVAIVNLQTDGKPINMNVVSMGALDQSIAHPREILKSTILSNASAIMLVHNHPSNKLQPSMDDIETTAREQMNAGSAKERLMKAIIGGILSVFVLKNRKYKKSTIAFLERFLNYLGVENTLHQFLSALSSYAIPEMEEFYVI